MNFNLNIQLGNDAMQTPENIAQALQVLADEMFERTAGDPYAPIELHPFGSCAGNVLDANGNRVGHWSVRA